MNNSKTILEDVFRKADSDYKYYNELMNNIFGADFALPRFEIVSFEQFKNDWIEAFDEYEDKPEDVDEIKDIYNDIKFPVRGTAASAGYDIFSPINFYLKPGESIMIPTGIRVLMPNDMAFMIYPRSGLSTKFRLIPKNLTAVIDADYAYADNEGHIHMAMTNDGDKVVTVEKGKAFCQGIFTKYYTTYNDSARGARRGGFGSTDKR